MTPMIPMIGLLVFGLMALLMLAGIVFAIATIFTYFSQNRIEARKVLTAVLMIGFVGFIAVLAVVVPMWFISLKPQMATIEQPGAMVDVFVEDGVVRTHTVPVPTYVVETPIASPTGLSMIFFLIVSVVLAILLTQLFIKPLLTSAEFRRKFATFAVRWLIPAGVVMLLLAAIGLPTFTHTQEAARREVLKQELKALGESLHQQGQKHLAQQIQLASVNANGPISALDCVNTQVQTAAQTPAEPLPEWITAPPKSEHGVEYVVVGSQQFATVEEARADANTQLIQVLQADLSPYAPRLRLRPRASLVDASAGPYIDPSQALQAVRETYVESTQRDFGTFTAPMYRLWYRVELSPAVRAPFLTAWHAQVIEARTLVVLAGLLSLLLVPLGVLVSSSVCKLTGGAASTLIQFAATTGVVTAWGCVAWALNHFVILWG